MKKLVIERAKWSRGDNINYGSDAGCLSDNRLWHPHGAGCCLGHLLHKIEQVPIEKLIGLEYPRTYYKVNECKTPLYSLLVDYDGENSSWTRETSNINDDGRYSEEERESALKKKFAQVDIDLEFV